MGNVINLNRFRKKKAREEKTRRAETNRRLHGRTKAERAQEQAEKKRLEDKLDSAFLVPDRVKLSEVPGTDATSDFEQLEAAAKRAVPIDELSKKSSDQD